MASDDSEDRRSAAGSSAGSEVAAPKKSKASAGQRSGVSLKPKRKRAKKAAGEAADRERHEAAASGSKAIAKLNKIKVKIEFPKDALPPLKHGEIERVPHPDELNAQLATDDYDNIDDRSYKSNAINNLRQALRRQFNDIMAREVEIHWKKARSNNPELIKEWFEIYDIDGKAIPPAKSDLKGAALTAWKDKEETITAANKATHRKDFVMQMRSNLHARDLLNKIAKPGDRDKLIADYPYLFNFGKEYADRSKIYGGLRGRPTVQPPTTYYIPTGEIYPTPKMLGIREATSMPPKAFSRKRKAKDGTAQLLLPEFQNQCFNSSKSALLDLNDSKDIDIAERLDELRQQFDKAGRGTMPKTSFELRNQAGTTVAQLVIAASMTNLWQDDKGEILEEIYPFYSAALMQLGQFPTELKYPMIDLLLTLAPDRPGLLQWDIDETFYDKKLAAISVQQIPRQPDQPKAAGSTNDSDDPKSIAPAKKKQKLAETKKAPAKKAPAAKKTAAPKANNGKKAATKDHPTSIAATSKAAGKKPTTARQPKIASKFMQSDTDEEPTAANPPAPDKQKRKMRQPKLADRHPLAKDTSDAKFGDDMFRPGEQPQPLPFTFGAKDMIASITTTARKSNVCPARWLCKTQTDRNVIRKNAQLMASKYKIDRFALATWDKLFGMHTEPLAPANEGMQKPEMPVGPFEEDKKFEGLYQLSQEPDSKPFVLTEIGPQVYRCLWSRVAPKKKIEILCYLVQKGGSKKDPIVVYTPSSDPWLTFYMNEWVHRSGPTTWSWETSDISPTSIADILGTYSELWKPARKEAYHILSEMQHDLHSANRAARAIEAVGLLRKLGITTATADQVRDVDNGWPMLATSCPAQARNIAEAAILLAEHLTLRKHNVNTILQWHLYVDDNFQAYKEPLRPT
ncbi:uncharacterized protein MYCGRDRAFT_90681 [Zymoseptoria tritici IPO323]|uniref:Uncharacterized protein n=1 Tax=Zymoseptoria tritici (strain CBS 115943 / IPO323) TaxID=336722 RepID=F9X280_ZYMTI|nr:uncharacterized protein MYCGRDRAFT_90681 [Zymoseptoria tritici IPO323]EGP90576.1 hypothetical protein MYCGRDRAFT_90681 [Zymoseptoria tritici IPO323]